MRNAFFTARAHTYGRSKENFDLEVQDISGELNLMLNIDRFAIYCNLKSGVVTAALRDREISSIFGVMNALRANYN